MQYKQKILFAFGQGAAQMGRWRLQSEAFNKLKMPYPCIKEQVQIADFINHENLKINIVKTISTEISRKALSEIDTFYKPDIRAPYGALGFEDLVKYFGKSENDVFYKTLDNEINANVAQTYIYVKSDGRCSEIEALRRLNDWETYKFYNNIKNIKLDILEDKLSKDEVDLFNSLLIKNGVRTISSDNISNWLRYWFKIFNRRLNNLF